MTRFTAVLLALSLALPAAAEMIQKKSGTFIEGKILEVTEKGIRIQLAEGGEATLSFEDLDPYTVWRVRDRRLRDAGDADAGPNQGQNYPVIDTALRDPFTG